MIGCPTGAQPSGSLSCTLQLEIFACRKYSQFSWIPQIQITRILPLYSRKLKLSLIFYKHIILCGLTKKSRNLHACELPVPQICEFLCCENFLFYSICFTCSSYSRASTMVVLAEYPSIFFELCWLWRSLRLLSTSMLSTPYFISLAIIGQPWYSSLPYRLRPHKINGLFIVQSVYSWTQNKWQEKWFLTMRYLLVS